ncbi:MAG: rhodanese-like domain-containing protein [Micropruina sp.]|nr:rhodanese-like domain-containing protein [Micropruina sp.]
MTVPEIDVTHLPDDAVLLDVREPAEWAAGRAPHAVLVPLGEIADRLGELPTTGGTIPVICRVGVRSARVTAFLLAQGFEAVNVAGGMQSWAAAGKPMLADEGEPAVI